MQKTTDEVVFLLITIILIVVDALQTILSIRTKGILIDQRQLLLQKTNKDLRGMLEGIPKTNKMKKAEIYQDFSEASCKFAKDFAKNFCKNLS